MLHNISKNFFIITLVLFTIQLLPAQDIIQPAPTKFSAEKTKILAELDRARLNHDTQKSHRKKLKPDLLIH